MKKSTEKLENFQVDMDMSVPQRIAAFLNWAASIAPGRPVEFTLLTKIVTKPGPRPSEKQIDSVKSATRRAKTILIDQYRRGLVAHPGYGVRATTDSEDLAKTQFQSDRRRVVNSLKSLDRSNSLINIRDIQDAELRNSVLKARGAMKVLVSNDVLHKLAPAPDKKD